MIVRLFMGVVFAIPVTLALFLLMQFLVTPQRSLIEEVADTVAIDILRAERPEESQNNNDLERPTEQDQPPPPPMMDTSTERPDLEGLNVGLPELDLDFGGQNLGPIDGDIQPLVRVPPEYPIRAAERGIEGVVCARFTVTAEGTVQNPEVYSSDHALLNSAALRAISRFRYNPKIENGEPVPRPNVRFCMDFRLNTDGRR